MIWLTASDVNQYIEYPTSGTLPLPLLKTRILFVDNKQNAFPSNDFAINTSFLN